MLSLCIPLEVTKLDGLFQEIQGLVIIGSDRERKEHIDSVDQSRLKDGIAFEPSFRLAESQAVSRACSIAEIEEITSWASSLTRAVQIEKRTLTAKALTVVSFRSCKWIDMPSTSRFDGSVEIINAGEEGSLDDLLVHVVWEVSLVDQRVDIARLWFGDVHEQWSG